MEARHHRSLIETESPGEVVLLSDLHAVIGGNFHRAVRKVLWAGFTFAAGVLAEDHILTTLSALRVVY